MRYTTVTCLAPPLLFLQRTKVLFRLPGRASRGSGVPTTLKLSASTGTLTTTSLAVRRGGRRLGTMLVLSTMGLAAYQLQVLLQLPCIVLDGLLHEFSIASS